MVSQQGSEPTPSGLPPEPEHSKPAPSFQSAYFESQPFTWTLRQNEEVELGEVPFLTLPVFLQLLSTAVVSLIKWETALGKLEASLLHSKILRIFMLVVK